MSLCLQNTSTHIQISSYGVIGALPGQETHKLIITLIPVRVGKTPQKAQTTFTPVCLLKDICASIGPIRVLWSPFCHLPLSSLGHFSRGVGRAGLCPQPLWEDEASAQKRPLWSAFTFQQDPHGWLLIDDP